jgi:uroporphyrinogen-III synthase/sugar phosphate isomerase/epimerase
MGSFRKDIKMGGPLLKSYKGRFPFKLSTTSYIYPDHILQNVVMLAPFFDEIELVLFESKGQDNLPNEEQMSSLVNFSKHQAIDFNIHLPIDIFLGDESEEVRSQGISILKRVIERTLRLKPSIYTLHFDIRDQGGRDETDIKAWKGRILQSIKEMLKYRIELCRISVETLSYPMEWIEDIIEEFGFSICLDIGHILFYGQNLQSYLEKYLPKTSIIHLHGVQNGVDHQGIDRLPEETLKIIHSYLRNYHGIISIEVFSIGDLKRSLIIVGEVVKLREKLRWFDNRPLFGKKILVTRSRDQASRLSEMLCEYGAELIEFPVLKILPPESFEGMDKALNHIEDYDWLLFTSSNGMRALVQRLWQLGRDIRWLKGPKIGAIDPKTAGVIRSFGVNVNFIPSKFATEAVVREFPEDLKGKSILFPLAGEAQDVLPEKLIAQGALVDVVIAYRTEIEESDVLKIKDLLDRGEIDVVTFTSSSTVRIFVELIGEGEKISLPEGVKVACIGPITAQEATEHGLKPDVVSDQQSIESLISAIAVAFNGRKEQLKIEPTEA